MNYIQIKNWEQFQHYKHRDPPWIKLYHSLLDDYEYGCLQDASKLLLMSLYMLASRTNNNIPADPDWIKQKGMLLGNIDLEPLITSGFISVNGNASEVLAQCKQDASEMLIQSRVEKSREECPKFETTSDEFRLSQLLLNLIQKRKPKFKKPDLQKWAKHLALMIYKDKRESSEIEDVINWCQVDEFWQNNILSTEKLREQFDQLSMKMDAELKKNSAKDSGLCEKCGKGQKYLGGLCIDCYYKKG